MVMPYLLLQKLRLMSVKRHTFFECRSSRGGKRNIDLSISGDVVSISAEIAQKDEQKEGNKVLRSERYYGSVSRSFQLPEKIDVDKAEASYENGILQLSLPKLTGSTSKKLEIK